MNTEDMVKRLKELKAAAQTFTGKPAATSEQTAWILKTKRLLETTFGEDSVYAVNFHNISWRHRGAAIIGGPANPRESYNPQIGLNRLATEANARALNIAVGILDAACEEVAEVGAENIKKQSKKDQVLTDLFEIIKLSETNFRKLFREKPKDEKEVQEKYEDLLNARGIKFDREKEAFPYSVKSYIADFTFPELNLATEIKICGDEKRVKTMIAEINDDIVAYGTKYKHILFVVYDLGFIRDVEGFKGSFEEHDNVIVLVVKH